MYFEDHHLFAFNQKFFKYTQWNFQNKTKNGLRLKLTVMILEGELSIMLSDRTLIQHLTQSVKLQKEISWVPGKYLFLRFCYVIYTNVSRPKLVEYWLIKIHPG